MSSFSDLCLPDMDGLRVLKQLREWNRAPVLILSGESDETRKVNALDGGANDYVSKPAPPRRVLARLRVLQRWDPGRATNKTDLPHINGESSRWTASPLAWLFRTQRAIDNSHPRKP